MRMILRCSRASELRYRECNRTEQTAGIVIVSSWSAFLVGYTVIRGRQKQLCRSFDTDNRKDTEGNQKSRRPAVHHDLSVRRATDALRDITDIAAAPIVAGAIDSSPEYDGLDGLNLGNGIGGLAVVYIPAAAVRATRL